MGKRGMPQEAAKLARTRSWAYADSVQGFPRRQSLQGRSHSWPQSIDLSQPDRVPMRPLQSSTQPMPRLKATVRPRGAQTRCQRVDHSATAPRTAAEHRGAKGSRGRQPHEWSVHQAKSGHSNALLLASSTGTTSGRPLPSRSTAACKGRPYSAPQSPTVAPLVTARRSASRSPRIPVGNRGAGPPNQSDRHSVSKEQILQKLAYQGSRPGLNLKAGLAIQPSHLIVAACPDLKVPLVAWPAPHVCKLACPANVRWPAPHICEMACPAYMWMISLQGVPSF